MGRFDLVDRFDLPVLYAGIFAAAHVYSRLRPSEGPALLLAWAGVALNGTCADQRRLVMLVIATSLVTYAYVAAED